MLSHTLSTIAGIEWLGTALLIVAMAAFLALGARAARMNSAYCRRMERLPLDAPDPAEETGS